MSRFLKFLFSFLILSATSQVFGQSFYEIKFEDSNGNEYTCFWVYKSESNTYMRIAFYNNDKYRVVNVEYKAETGKTDDGVYYLYCEGSNPKYITAHGDGESYTPDHFMWVRYEGEEYGLPFVTDDPELNVDNFRECTKYVELHPADFNEEYLNQFFAKDEEDYIALMNMVDDQSSNGGITYSYSGQGDTWAGGGNSGGGSQGDSGHHGDSWTGGNSGGGNTGGQHGDMWTGDSNSGNNNSGNNNSGGGNTGGQHGDMWTGNNSGSNNSGGNNGGNTNTWTGNSNAQGDGGHHTSTGGGNSGSGGSGSFTFHLVIAANTDIGDIGTSCDVDKRNLVNEFEGICEVMNIKLKKYIVDGKNFTKSYLTTTLKSVNPGSNDIVMFVYTGHGFRWSDQTERFPQLDMRYNPYTSITSETSINLKEVYDIITAKGARLNIVMGDCCNSDVGVNQRTSNTFMASRNDANFNRKNLTKLFFNSKGNILATAASPGQVSWSNAVNGGFFLSSFFQAFREEIGYMDTDPQWDDLIANTIKYAAYKSSKAACSNCTEQNGQKSVSVSY